MREIDELLLPDDLRYTETHEWVRDGDIVTVGINDYAQDQLGDIVFVELPEVGARFEKGEAFGTMESVKAVSEIYMPFSAEVTAVNDSLEETPELVNRDPYNDGWVIKVKPDDPEEINSLMNKSEYIKMLKGAE